MPWTNKLLSITLTCYIAVSSIAAVHAFPAIAPQSDSSHTSTSMAAPMSMPSMPMPAMESDCHQAQPTASQNSISSCDLVCAALANVISNEPLVDLLPPAAGTEFAFLTSYLLAREPALEPHPPK